MSDRARATNGRRAPQGPIPPLNSCHITPITPRALASPGSSSEATLTTYSSAIEGPPASPMHESDADAYGEKANCIGADRDA